MLTAAALAALWSLYDATGIRPEYLLPVLWVESGFDPSHANAQGTPYYGIGQTSGAWLRSQGVDPADFLTWDAGAQIRFGVSAHYRDTVARYGPIRSATRALQANIVPATLATARSLAAPVLWRGSAFYDANAGLDRFHRGAITVSDFAAVAAHAASAPQVQAAILAAYALRPSERPKNAVYGDDFKDPRWWLLAPVVLGAYALASEAR